MQELLAPEFTVRVIVRDPARLPGWIRQEVEVVRGSSDDPATLRWALEGIESLFWCVPPDCLENPGDCERYAKAAAQAISSAQTPRVVSISAGRSGRAPHTSRIGRLQAMEETLTATGAAIRHLRSGWLMDNLLSQASFLRDHGRFYYPAPALVPVPMTALEDLVDASLRWLVRRDWSGAQTMLVHGLEDLTLDRAAAVLEQVLERPIEYKEVTQNQLTELLSSMGMEQQKVQHHSATLREFTQMASLGNPCPQEPKTGLTLRTWAERLLAPLLCCGGGEHQWSSLAGCCR